MISKEEVRHIASLARVGLSDGELEKFSKDLSSILDWMDELKTVDISETEPMAHTTGMKNIMRKDKAFDFDSKSDIVSLFPEEKSGYDKVKSVL